MMQRNGPNLQPLAKSGRHRKTPALHLSAAPCQEEAPVQEPRQPDLQAHAPAQTVEADRGLENLPPPRRPLKLAPLAPHSVASELKDTQQPVKARSSGGKVGGGAAVPPPQEPKVGMRKMDGLNGADASPRKVKGCPAREASPARSPERPPLCRMRPIVEFPKAASSSQQQPTLGAKTLLLPVPQSEHPRKKSPGRDQENFPSSTPPPVPSSKRSGPLSLSVSPSRLPPDALLQGGTQAGTGGHTPTSSSSSSECGSLVEGAQGRARPRLRRIPRLEEDQGRSAPAQAPAPVASVAGLPSQERVEEAKPGHLAQAGGQRAERALREATRALEKASRRKPAVLDGPGKASRKMVVNVIPAAVH